MKEAVEELVVREVGVLGEGEVGEEDAVNRTMNSSS